MGTDVNFHYCENNDHQIDSSALIFALIQLCNIPFGLFFMFIKLPVR